MGLALGRRSAVRAAVRHAAARAAPRPHRLRSSHPAGASLRRVLPPADKLQIDLRGQFGIEQRAMLGAHRQIDVEALAKFVQRIARAGNFAPWRSRWCRWRAHRESAGAPTRCNSALRNFRSKLALWMTSGASPMNSRNSSAMAANSGLSGEEFVADAVDALGFDRHERARD